tara:strand:+ start:2446 stop:4350 length:1905 start_codon:yes stop_codon:yes gene_type:complete
MARQGRRLPEFNYSPGTRVLCHGKEWVIQNQIGSDQLQLESRDGIRNVVVKSHEVSPPSSDTPVRAISAIPDDDVETAKKRFEIIRPVIEGRLEDRGQLVKAAAAQAGKTLQTLYSWIRDYEKTGTVSSLAPKRKGSQRGQKRLSSAVEAIITAVIEAEYLTKQRKSIKTVHLLIRKACVDAGIKNPPSLDTVHRRIKALPAELTYGKRHGSKAARDKFGAAAGKFQGGEYPLQTVQMDHTKLDIILVNNETGDAIGRPWLTIAVDVFSGMLTGIHLSYDPPSMASVGMCFYRSATHKDEYLKNLGVEGRWPVWGIPSALHVDNGMDFRSSALREACEEYGVTLEYRPVRRPEFGGHVERAFRSINSFIHELPGTTRSNVQDRGEYKSEKEAVFTINQLEELLVGHIVNVLHNNKRKSDKTTPIDRWERGISDTHQMIPVQKPEKLYVDFLPQETRSVQRQGIQLDYIHYFDLPLKQFIGTKQALKVKRDPRDISRIYVLNPNTGEHMTVGYADRRNGRACSLAEWRALLADFESKSWPKTENRLFAELERRDQIEEEAHKAKRKAKRVQRQAAQKERNQRDLQQIRPEEKTDGGSGLTVINGGRALSGKPRASVKPRKFELRNRGREKRYEDW